MDATTVSLLQVLGWALTVVGQIQVARRRRSAFVVWGVSNAVLIAVNLAAGLPWSAAMFASNLALCVWSYARWSAPVIR